MELVPIIYSVLILVAVLAVTTIIVSYVSFKIKQKKGLVDSPSITDNNQHLKFESPVRKVIKRITKPLLRPEYLSENKPDLKPIVPKPEQAPVQKIIKKDLHQVKSEPKENLPKNNRIEVIKSSKKTPQESLENNFNPPVKNKKNDPELKTLGENVLDKYADDQDDTMFTLNVKNNKDNKKK